METTGQETSSSSNTDQKARRCPCLSSATQRACARMAGFCEKVKKIAKDDPRRIAHSFKVGLALTLVSVIYYVTLIFSSFGDSAMWAVLTVVVVMEYTVGGTLSKGLNRAFATLLAGALGLGAHQVAILCGETGEPVVLGLFVFLLAAAATFSRFIPEIKARYDYGVTIFILTFSLVAVSSYREEELIQLAHQRLSTIAIGVATCLCTTIFVFPVWAGEDLHLLVAGHLDKLATFLEGLESECFDDQNGGIAGNLEGKPFLHAYRSVLNSKPTEDSLFNFARWEPCHRQFNFRHPWKQYQKVATLCRQCASSMEALTTYITSSSKNINKVQPCKESELGARLRTACKEMSSESSKGLRGLSTAVRTMKSPSSLAGCHVSAAAAGADELRAALSEVAVPSDVLHVATVASLLAELVARTEAIAGSVEELARLAGFKPTEPVRGPASIQPVSSPAHVIINVN